jgi:hypothetical protein
MAATIVEVTESYEKWLRSFIDVNQEDLNWKYERMADRSDSFPFFRGTYYRWAQTWSFMCPQAAQAPQCLCVGDIHVENFGTWRDADGRLCWGVNDFDDADVMPYTNDLIRLATSLLLAKWMGVVDIKFGQACKSILRGYRKSLEAGGVPFVLEEKHPELRELAMADDRKPADFWKKLTKLLDEPQAELTDAARLALLSDMPDQNLKPQIRFRPRVGMGSLGKPRYIALAQWVGSWTAREVKATIPPGSAFVNQQTGRTSFIAEIVRRAVRCPDPFFRTDSYWTARRLSPRCSRIELKHFAGADEMLTILESTGAETANIHAGTPGITESILDHLESNKKDWLENAAKTCAEAVEKDWKQWKKHYRDK